MFAYCNNNPANCHDPSGMASFWTSTGDVNPLLSGYYGFGGGGSVSGNLGSTQEAQKILQREINYLTNTDERVVLESKGLSFYHGIPVFKADFGQSGGFSFIIIVLDDNYTYDETGIKTIKHEYGHRQHMDDIGVVNYFVTTAIPSLIGAGLSNAGIINVDYFSLPWEYAANMYGRVDHSGYTTWASDYGMLFLKYTYFVSKLTGGI
jgi:hypothetical protein